MTERLHRTSSPGTPPPTPRRVKDAERATDRFRTLVTATTQMVWTADALGTVVEDSPSWRAFTGQRVEQYLGRGWLDALHPDDRTTAVEAWQKAIETRAPYEIEYRLRRHDGVYRLTTARGAPVLEPDGTVREWVGTNKDITERRRAEQRLRILGAASSALVGSLELEATLGAISRLLVPNVADLLTVDIVDEEGVRKRVSVCVADPSKADLARRLEQFTFTADERNPAKRAFDAGKPVLVKSMTPAILDAAAWSPDHRAILEGLGVRSVMSVPLVSRGQVLGVFGFADLTGDHAYDEDELAFVDEIGRLVAVVIDNARLLEAAQRERRRAEAANDAKDDFLAAISHELRTPLSAIVGWVQLLRTDDLPPERRARALETIERNARAQTQLVEDLLDVSRIVTGKLQLELADVDLGDVAAMAAETVKPTADAKGVVLLLDLGGGGGAPPVVRGDAARLQQVVWNLLSNAVKFTPAGGRVDVRLRVTGTALDLEVADTGVGISPEFLPHVFERFRQSSAGSMRKQGLGLGMAIARHIVDLHGGTLAVTSDGEGRGATFVVRIPIAVRRPAGPPPADRTLERLPDLTGARLLVVDDDPDMLEPLVEVLERVGATVSTADSVGPALEQVKTKALDGLISDLGMPGEDGFALIRKVRALPAAQGGRIPAIALTGYARNEDRTRALVAGFNLHVAKPVQPAELVVALASLLGRLESSPASARRD